MQCTFCQKGWQGPKVHRVPQPIPDANNLGHYLHPSETAYEGKAIDDYQPRVQLQDMFDTAAIDLNNEDGIASFSKKFAVPEDLVQKRLKHLQHLKLMKTKRHQECVAKKVAESTKEYDDFNWIEMYEQNIIKRQRKEILDKFLLHHNKTQEIKYNKPAKVKIIEAIVARQIAESQPARLAVRKKAKEYVDNSGDGDHDYDDDTGSSTGSENDDTGSSSENDDSEYDHSSSSDNDTVIQSFDPSESDSEGGEVVVKTSRGRTVKSTRSKDYKY